MQICTLAHDEAAIHEPVQLLLDCFHELALNKFPVTEGLAVVEFFWKAFSPMPLNNTAA